MRLKDTQIQSFLTENGFCKYDLQAKAILPELKELYQSIYGDEPDKKFFVTHNTGNAEKALYIHQEINRICEPIISEHFQDYEVFAAHFVVKKAQSETSFQLHQDWNNLDESVAKSLQVWIPLEASYPEKGGLGFFPKSHRFFENYRSGSFDIPRVEVESKLFPYLSYVRLFPGEAALFYTATFHCSFINSTDENRVAALLNIVPKGSQNIYCHKNGSTVEKYAINALQLYERLHLLEKGEVPEGLNLLEKGSYSQIDNKEINTDLLIEKITKVRSDLNLPADYEEKQIHIIRDKELEKEINHKGYKVIDFLTEREVSLLLELFPRFFPDRENYKGRYSTMDHLPKEKTLEAHLEIQKIIKPRLEHFFREAYSPVSLLYSKKPDGVLDIDWHSDPSFILNESLEPIYGIWCALKDIGPKEGTLMIVPGSHRFIKRLNGTYVTWESPLKNYWRDIDQYQYQPSLKAGQAILFDSRMIHSSTPNTSKINRDCVVMRVTSNSIKDFFHVEMNSEKEGQGFLFRNNDSFFFTDIAKTHQGKTNPESSEGMMSFFDYPMDLEQIHSYFKRFQ